VQHPSSQVLRASRFLYDLKILELASQTVVYVYEGDVIVRPAITQGLTPAPTSGGSSLLKVAFAYGDATPKAITTQAGLIATATIVITTPFNGVGAALQLGDAVQPSRLLAPTQIDPTFAAEYEANAGHVYTLPTEILLTITPGAGATQGAGYVLLEV
jgi:hypothetical protein